MPGEFDLDQPVELRVRGDWIDLGGLLAFLDKQIQDANGRVGNAGEAFIEGVEEQVNFGYLEREMKRLNRELDNGDVDPDAMGFRGFQVLVDAFDPRHPEPDDPPMVRLSPLDEAEWYLVFMRSDTGFEAAGYPEETGVEDRMLMASLLRQYARDLEDELPDEGAVTEASDE